MVRTAPHDSGATTGRRRTDAEFEAVLEQELRNSPAKQRAMRRLRRLMDADGQVVLRGGVRGWMLILDCGASRPRWLLEELATYGLITLRITPTGERTLCAEVAVCAAFEATADAAPGASGGANARRRMDTTLADASTDPTNHSTPVVNRSPLEAPILNQPNQGSDAGGSGPAPDRLMSAATRPLTEAPVAPPSKPTLNSAESDGQAPWTPPVAPDAGRVGGDPSRIDPPPHPPMWNHDSMQQQHGHTQSEEPTGISFVQRLLQAFPETDRALLTAWASNPLVNECAAALAALQGFPTATLEAWQQDLAAARSRPNIVLPEGLVLACWSRGERVNAARVRPSATPQATPRQERRRSQPAAPRAYDAARVRAQLTLAAALDGAPNPTEGSGLEPPSPARATTREEPLVPATPQHGCAAWPGGAGDANYDAAAEGRTEAPEGFLVMGTNPAVPGATLVEPDLAPPVGEGPDCSDPTTQGRGIRQAWQATLATLREACARQEFDTWLRATRLIALDDRMATIQAPAALLAPLQARYQVVVQRALRDVLGRLVQVEFVA